jgi:hypothetical protein
MPRWQSNFNKNSVTAKLVSEIAVRGTDNGPPLNFNFLNPGH